MNKKENNEKVELLKEITESPTFKMASEAIKQRKKIEEDMRKITEPYLDTIKSIKEGFKSKNTIKIPYHRSHDEDILNKLEEIDSKIKSPKQIARKSYLLPKDAKWHKLDVKFFDGHTVKVSYEGMPIKTFDYKDMGFCDHKTNNPDTKWEFLRNIAESGGSLTISKYNRKFNRNIKYQTNKILKAFFGMKGNPIPWYTKDDGYKPLFNIK